MTQFLTTAQGRRIAYVHGDGQGPTVMFCGGFKSDMTGTKAVRLDAWAKARGQAFVRFDYSGHGASAGAFEDGAIGDWYEDAHAVIDGLSLGRVVLVGSSMGGWIALLLAAAMPTRITGLVGIAAAPDFTEDSIWAGLSPTERADVMETGRINLPSEYGDAPYVITRRLIVEGRRRLVLRSDLNLPFPVRLLQGTADIDVPPSVALRLMDHARCDDLRLTLVKGADHRFSTPDCLALIGGTLDEMLKGAANA